MFLSGWIFPPLFNFILGISFCYKLLTHIIFASYNLSFAEKFQVAQFICNQNERQPRKHVLVHCTHGHNRTGFMIVHYLMRTQQASCVTEVSLVVFSVGV